ncbi:MAG: hypothetical protein ACOQNY_01370 [Mycoplasmoidaceae bacterium]
MKKITLAGLLPLICSTSLVLPLALTSCTDDNEMRLVEPTSKVWDCHGYTPETSPYATGPQTLALIEGFRLKNAPESKTLSVTAKEVVGEAGQQFGDIQSTIIPDGNNFNVLLNLDTIMSAQPGSYNVDLSFYLDDDLIKTSRYTINVYCELVYLESDAAKSKPSIAFATGMTYPPTYRYGGSFGYLFHRPNGATYKMIITDASPELGEFDHQLILNVSSGDYLVNATINFNNVGDIPEDKDITLKWKIVTNSGIEVYCTKSQDTFKFAGNMFLTNTTVTNFTIPTEGSINVDVPNPLYFCGIDTTTLTEIKILTHTDEVIPGVSMSLAKIDDPIYTKYKITLNITNECEWEAGKEYYLKIVLPKKDGSGYYANTMLSAKPVASK